MPSDSSSQDVLRQDTRQWYTRYYNARGADRNDLLTNSGVLFQTLAFDKANIRALGRLDLDRSSARVFDVGCGSGSSLLLFVRLGFRPHHLAGIDLDPDRIDAARLTFPGADFRCGDATATDFEDESFDVTFESTMFVQMTDEALPRIAREC